MTSTKKELKKISKGKNDFPLENTSIWQGTLDIMLLGKRREDLMLFDIYQKIVSMYEMEINAAIERQKLKNYLVSLLGCIALISALLMVIFYSILKMPNIGLSFIGPLLTSIIGLVLFYFLGRERRFD